MSYTLDGKVKVDKLAIGYPWVSPFIWTFFTESALNLRCPVEHRWIRGKGWCPARRHIDICEKAVEWGASHVLILGSDQVYPEDMIERLIKRHEDDGCDVIAAMVPTRGNVPAMNMKPFQPMAWRFKENAKMENYRSFDLDSGMIEAIDPKNGDVQEVDFIGSGVLMFPVDVLMAIPKPWFWEKFDKIDYKRQASMDTRFVWALKRAGHSRVYVDTTIKVGHINPMVIDDTYQNRFMDWQETGYGECKVSLNA